MRISSSKNNYAFSDNEYGRISLIAGNQSTGIAATNPFKFDTLISGNVTFDGANYRVTLKKNRTYFMTVNAVGTFSNADGYIQWRAYNVTDGAYLSGYGICYGSTHTSAEGTYSPLTTFITTTKDTVVEIRISAVSNLSNIQSAYTWWDIQQINIISPVIQMPYLITSPQSDLTVTLANWTTTKAVGIPYVDKNGIWRLRFNIIGAMSSGARTGITLTISGVTFATGNQVIVGDNAGVNTSYYSIADTAASTITISHANGTTTVYRFFGDVALASKPTWV